MIDTVIISISKSKVRSVGNTNNDSFGWNQHSQTSYYSKFVKNPSKKDLESGLYFPRLTGINRKRDGVLDASIKIEFSIPKLLYMNNLDEVEEKDFSLVVSTLKDRLLRMGILISEKDLRFASVSAVHYSKNILLTNGYTTQFVLSELNKIDVRKTFDLTKTRFMNDGESLCIYANSHSFIAYDKISDLNKDLKRAIDKDPTRYQRSLFDQIDKKELYEVIRFEVRLSKKHKIKSLFKKLNFPDNPNFEQVFSLKISKEILNFYWQTMVSNNSLILFSFVLTPKDVLKQILIANPKLKPKQAIYFASLVSLTKDGNGMRELRSNISKYSDDRTWYRIKEDVREVTELLKSVRPRDWFDQIEGGFREYKAFKQNGP